MRKSLGILGAVISLLVLPSAASAAVLYDGEAKVPIGTQVVGTGFAEFMYENASGYYLSCSKAAFTGTVYANGPDADTHVNGATFEGPSGGKCESIYGPMAVTMTKLPKCLRAPSFQISSMVFTSTGCGINNGTAVRIKLAGVINCEYDVSSWPFKVPQASPLKIRTSTNPWQMTLVSGESAWCWPHLRPYVEYDVKTAAGNPLSLKLS